jgi:hypothetical protein
VNRKIPAVAVAAALTLPGAAVAADPLDLRFAGEPTVAEQMQAHRHHQVHRQLVRRYQGLTGERRRAWSVQRLQKEIRAEKRERRERRAQRRAARQAQAATPQAQAAAPQAPASHGQAAVPGHLAAIAACESGGDPSAVGGGGAYRGKYQFDHQTWASVGGSGDPAAASEAEQDMRAAMLYQRAGASPWPTCGR